MSKNPFPEKSRRAAPSSKSSARGMTRPPIWRMDLIHRRIAAGGYPNCTELAEETEVAAKTIQRDITFMQTQRNLPIEYDAVKHGYYYTEPVSEFPELTLTRGELVALFLTRKALEPMKGGELEALVMQTLAKLADNCPEVVTVNWEELDQAFSVSGTGEVAADAMLFGHLVDAVMNQREVTFDYLSLKGRKTQERRVQPYHVGRMNGGWYLIGMDLASCEVRTFALQRLADLRLTKVKFVRPADFNIHEHLSTGFGVWSYGNDTGVTHKVRVQFTGWAAQVVKERRWHSSQVLADEADGSVIFSATVAGLEEVVRWVLGYGSKAVVLAPEALRKRVRAEVTAMGAALE